MSQSHTNAPDERVAHGIVRLLASLARPPGPHKAVQVRRLLPGGLEGYAWTGRTPTIPPRAGRQAGR